MTTTAMTNTTTNAVFSSHLAQFRRPGPAPDPIRSPSASPASPLTRSSSTLKSKYFSPEKPNAPPARSPFPFAEAARKDGLDGIEAQRLSITTHRPGRGAARVSGASLHASSESSGSRASHRSLIRQEAVSSKPVKKKKRMYAEPAVYAHLNHLPDLLKPNLDVVFCGINPGCRSAAMSHYYAHPTNDFWKCLHLSGLTSTCLAPSDDRRLPREFGLGLTDLVSRPTAEANELSAVERLAAVPALLRKVLRFRPRFLCFVGVRQYHDLCTFIKKNLVSSFSPLPNSLGLQNIVFSYRSSPAETVECSSNTGRADALADQESLEHTFIFVTPSTSALARKYRGLERVRFFTRLRECKEEITSKDLAGRLSISGGP